jgi:hypothetical protein
MKYVITYLAVSALVSICTIIITQVGKKSDAFLYLGQ